MKLPNTDCAIIPIEKLVGYCLNPEHPKGKHKARVFQWVLGITRENVDSLYQLVRQAAITGEVIQERSTPFGQEFKVDWTIPGLDQVQLRTLWIISSESIIPQLVSAFIKS
jgi:hypothetical protein